MKYGFNTRRLTRSIRGLFSTKSRPGPHKRLPDDYYKNIWLTKKMHTGVEIIAKIEGISNKAAANMLIGSGISRYLGELLKKHIENERLNRERAEGTEQIATLKGMKLLRKYLEEHGMSKYKSKTSGL